jgi:flavin-binding protein dodecin
VQTLVTRGQWREDETVSIDEPRQGGAMSDSVYKVIEVIGTSSTSWEEAAKTAVDKVASHLEDVRVAEVVELDLRLEENKVMAYRAKVKVSFKYHEGE